MILEEFLSKEYGYNAEVKDSYIKYINLWESWYRGFNEDFHKYLIYNGRNEIPMHRHTLNMAKKCCEDWADLLFNEKCMISVSEDESNNVLQDILTKLNFWEFANRAIEKAGSVGTGAIVLSLDNIIKNNNIYDSTNAKAKLTYIHAINMYPLSWDNDKIKECAFANTQIINGEKYINLSCHKTKENGNYVIYNHVFKCDKYSGDIEEIEQDNIIPEFDTGSNIPWFVVIMPNSNNNKQVNSPFGISFFANSIDILKSIDIDFDSFVNEVTLSRKRIFVRDDLIDYGEDGKQHPVFHNSDIAVYTLPNGMNKDDLIQSENSEIRATDLERSLKNSLSLFSSSVGFGADFYTFDKMSMKTATQVVSEQNAMFRRKKKHEILLESALYDIIKAICYALNTFSTYNINDDGLTIKFDDSIIEDMQSESERALRELQNGIISVVEYRQRIFGETEELAKEKYRQVLEYKAQENKTDINDDLFKIDVSEIDYANRRED